MVAFQVVNVIHGEISVLDIEEKGLAIIAEHNEEKKKTDEITK